MKQQATSANKVQGKKHEGNLLDYFSCSKKLQQKEVITIDDDDSRVMTPTAKTAAKDVASRAKDVGGTGDEDVDDEESDEDYVPVEEDDDDCCVIDLNDEFVVDDDGNDAATAECPNQNEDNIQGYVADHLVAILKKDQARKQKHSPAKIKRTNAIFKRTKLPRQRNRYSKVVIYRIDGRTWLE